MDRRPVSSNIVPSDFHLLVCHFKKHRTKKHLQQMPTHSQETSSWLQAPDTDFFYAGTKALVPQCDKCLNVIAKIAEV
jgi:hypothetical protein